MVQFGVSGDPNVQKKHKKAIKDDPVLESNKRGTMTFATSGPNTRTTQLFINTNTEDNAFLDEQGFAPFAQVLSGMEFVDQIFDGYREKPDQGLIQQEGNAYLEKEFPKLSWINAVKEIQ
jgi:cyclophilin family peptidyl-prolyl cis-trans isomerase